MPQWFGRIVGVLLYPSATRERRRTSLVMLFILVMYSIQYARGLSIHPVPESDGFFSWMYATSLSFDHDLDLTNDYTVCGKPKMVVDHGGGVPANSFYFGPALVWTPILTLVRIFFRLPAHAPEAWRHACAGPYAQLVGATSPLFTMLTVWIAYRVARRWVKQPYALAGALIGAFGTTLVTYGAPIWFYSHLWSAFAVALVMLAFVRATERPDVGRWVLFGLAVAFAALMRPQEALWISLGVVWLISELFGRSERRLNLESAWRLLRPALAWTWGFASLYWVQLFVYKRLYGRYWVVPQGEMWLQPKHPHPFLMLFSGYSGWFTWTPLVWLGVFGILRMMFRRSSRLMGIGLLLGCALQIYISGSVLAWTGSTTWGQRMLTSLAPPVVVGAAVISQSFGEWVRRRVDRTRFLLIVACAFPLMFMTFGTPFVDPAKVRGADVYGAAVSQNFTHLEKKLGNPFTLPATEVFAVRYQVPRQKFDDLAFTGSFVRNFRTAKTVAHDTLAFASPPEWISYAEGIEMVQDGARIRSGHGRLLLTLYWPWVTHIRLTVKLEDPKPTTIRLRAKGFLTSTELGTMVYAPNHEEQEWHLPAAGLDSGINEIIVDADNDITLRTLVFIDRSQHDRAP